MNFRLSASSITIVAVFKESCFGFERWEEINFDWLTKSILINQIKTSQCKRLNTVIILITPLIRPRNRTYLQLIKVLYVF